MLNFNHSASGMFSVVGLRRIDPNSGGIANIQKDPKITRENWINWIEFKEVNKELLDQIDYIENCYKNADWNSVLKDYLFQMQTCFFFHSLNSIHASELDNARN